MYSKCRSHLIGCIGLILGSVCGGAVSDDHLSHADCTEQPGYYRNPLDVPVADPFVLLHEGTYYLYGTYDPAPNQGLRVWVSNNLVNWKEKGVAFRKTSDTWSQTHFWGPEVIAADGRFLMFFSASPNKNPQDRPLNMSLCIAESKSPLGPFTETATPFYSPTAPDEAIDQNIFIDIA